jgi:hypothetical protein
VSGNGVRRGVSCEPFDMGLLARQIKHRSHLPEHGFSLVNIDTSQCSDDPRSDLSALCAGLIHLDELENNRQVLWITDVEFGHYLPAKLPAAIANFVKTHPANRSCIEKINGSAFLKVLVDQEFAALGVNPNVLRWNSARNIDAKAHRIGGKLVKLHKQDRLRLVAAPWNDEFLRQAEKWDGTSKNRGRKDDVLDACAGLAAGVSVL